MLDIIYHPKHPIEVNTVNKDGDCVLYRILCETLQNIHDKIEEDDDMAEIFKPQPFYVNRKFRKRIRKMTGKKEWVIKILLYSGADLNFMSSSKAYEAGSLLHFAVERNLLQIVEWLVEKGVDVNGRTTMLHRTPLMIAALKGHGDIVMFLLNKGAMLTLNDKDDRGWTPLHFAAGFCNPLIVKSLLLAGADKEMTNKAGNNPVYEAKLRGRKENVDILLTHNPCEGVRENIDRLDYLKKAHKDDIEAVIQAGRNNMRQMMMDGS